METLTDYNKRILEIEIYKNKYYTGISCPHCYSELQDEDNHTLLLSYPAQKVVVCFACGFKGTRYVP